MSNNTYPNRKRLRVLLAIFVLLVSFSAHAEERLSWLYTGYDKLDKLFNTESGPLWGEKQYRRTYHLRFVIEGESLENWTEILEIINTYRRDEPDNTHLWFERFQKRGNETCMSEWNIIEEQADSMIFQRSAKNCQEFEDQDALYRILYGRKKVFLIFAMIKGKMDKASRKGWMNVLESAEIRK